MNPSPAVPLVLLAALAVVVLLARIARLIRADRLTPALPVAAPVESEVIEQEIPYDPLDHRIPLAEVERRMATFVIEAACVSELVAA